MSEPISGAAAGAAGIKLLGGTSIGAGVISAVVAIGVALAAVVVMCLTTPRNAKEWAVGMISTVVASIGGGCAVISHYGLQSWANDTFGLIAMLGLVFACGLPGWAIVRWSFNYIIKSQAKGIDEVANDVKGMVP